MYRCESWTIKKAKCWKTDAFKLWCWRRLLRDPCTVKSNQSAAAAAAAKSLQSCPTLCNPIDGSPPGTPVPGILQARTLEWVAISFSNAWKWKVKVKSLSHVRLLATPWTAAHQAPPSMGFSRQEYWSGVPLPSPMAMLVGMKWYLWEFYVNLSNNLLILLGFPDKCKGHLNDKNNFSLFIQFLVSLFHMAIYW